MDRATVQRRRLLTRAETGYQHRFSTALSLNGSSKKMCSNSRHAGLPLRTFFRRNPFLWLFHFALDGRMPTHSNFCTRSPSRPAPSSTEIPSLHLRERDVGRGAGGWTENVRLRHRSVKLLRVWLMPGILYIRSRRNCSYPAVPDVATLM
jgi:hypothetical protein